MAARPEISVVVPVFNGGHTLGPLLAGLREAADAAGLGFETLLIDDGSTDDSWRKILDLRAQHGDLVRGFRLARNFGQQAATYCGLLEARGAWVVTLDDDLEPHPREILKLWEHARSRHSDVVYGLYTGARHGVAHRLGTWLFRMLVRRVAPSFPDGSAFRLIRSEVLRSLPRNAGPWLLVDPVLAWQTSAVSTVTVDHGSNGRSRSRYSLSQLFAIAWTVLITYSKVPLRLMTLLGFVSAVVSFAVGIYYLIQKITIGAQIGFSALIVTTTFSSSVILLSLGILGEYISRIHTMGSGEPAFTVKTVV
jgi:undecaprenyl-phosphate 4-deoxy-4-formamido-L-arabinose transferase